MKNKIIVKIIIGMLLVMLISALLAPLLAMFLDFKFRRIVSRCVMIGTFMLIALIVKQQKIRAKDFFRSMGLAFTRERFIEYVKGFVLCGIFVGGIIFFQVIFGVRFKQVNMTAVEIILNVFKIIGAAVVIGIIEEVFFRGIVYRSMKKQAVPFAFVISALFYSIVHFLAKGDVFVDATPTVIDSFRVIGAFFGNFAEPAAMFPAFLGLIFFGFALQHAYARSGALYFPMGIHAGAVFCLKFSKSVSALKEESSRFLYGSSLLYDGVLGWVFLIGLWLFVYYIYKKKEDKGHVELFGES